MHSQPESAYPLVVGVSGASGAMIARALLTLLRDNTNCRVDAVFTPTAEQVWQSELGEALPVSDAQLTVHAISDFTSPLASGTYPTQGMIVAPCSMATLAKIAHGIADNLLTRAADVTIKEGRRLVLVPRESPLSSIHLRNMLTLSEMGVVIAPPMPAFYERPATLALAIDSFAAHLLNLVQISIPRKVWGVDTLP